jgi:hypothetical protein
MDFDKTIEGFQEGWSLEAYVRAGNFTKQKNQKIIDTFEEEGQKGIDYLCGELNNEGMCRRQQVAHILGEIGKKDKNEGILYKLRDRKKIESEAGVTLRIDYSIDLILGFEPEEILRLYSSPIPFQSGFFGGFDNLKAPYNN